MSDSDSEKWLGGKGTRREEQRSGREQEKGCGKETAEGLWDGSNSYRQEKRKVK